MSNKSLIEKVSQSITSRFCEYILDSELFSFGDISPLKSKAIHIEVYVILYNSFIHIDSSLTASCKLANHFQKFFKQDISIENAIEHIEPWLETSGYTDIIISFLKSINDKPKSLRDDA